MNQKRCLHKNHLSHCCQKEDLARKLPKSFKHACKHVQHLKYTLLDCCCCNVVLFHFPISSFLVEGSDDVFEVVATVGLLAADLASFN